jgi:hypothetical protein
MQGGEQDSEFNSVVGGENFFFGFADGAGGCFVGGIPLYKLDVETDWAGYTARQGEDFLV